MAIPDPIGPVVQALSVLVAPNPALNTASPQPPSTWTGGSNAATDGTLFTPAQALLGVLFGLSSDMTSVGNAVNTGLTDIAGVIASIAALGSLATIETEATGAFSALKTVLSWLSRLRPAAPTGCGTASGLFDQLQALISALGSIGVAAAELGELSRPPAAAAPLFPAQPEKDPEAYVLPTLTLLPVSMLESLGLGILQKAADAALGAGVLTLNDDGNGITAGLTLSGGQSVNIDDLVVDGRVSRAGCFIDGLRRRIP